MSTADAQVVINAEGAAHAFSQGVAAVDTARLQSVAPYPAHRKNYRLAGAVYDSPSSLSPEQMEEMAKKSIAASPDRRSLIGCFSRGGTLAAKAAYLILDTMKVAGYCAEFPKAMFALFYVDLADPLAGGTGHIIRVCRQEGVPYAFQDVWQSWIK